MNKSQRMDLIAVIIVMNIMLFPRQTSEVSQTARKLKTININP